MCVPGASSKSEECGTCKEEVEREEAEALAKALAVSDRQDPIPIVPGLTPTTREEVITIRIQPDNVSFLDECVIFPVCFQCRFLLFLLTHCIQMNVHNVFISVFTVFL